VSRVRQIAATDDLIAADTLEHPDRATVLELTAPGASAHSAEQWARTAFEAAPWLLRLLLPLSWRLGLGLRLGPRSSPQHILGWRVVRTRPDAIILELDSRLITAHNVVVVADSRVRWAAFVRYERRGVRALWALAVPIHRLTLSYVLSRAATRLTT
jgi:hypothetical protein